jgi:hypothetical protein
LGEDCCQNVTATKRSDSERNKLNHKSRDSLQIKKKGKKLVTVRKSSLLTASTVKEQA